MEQIYNDDVWIYHYGVKGMKWGVRRQIAAKAKASAIMRRDIGKLDNKIRKLENKQKRKGLSIKQETRLKENRGARRTLTRARNQYMKNLNPKDVQRGERAIRALGLIGLGGITGGAIAEASRQGAIRRADQAIGKSSKKRSKELTLARSKANGFYN